MRTGRYLSRQTGLLTASSRTARSPTAKGWPLHPWSGTPSRLADKAKICRGPSRKSKLRLTPRTSHHASLLFHPRRSNGRTRLRRRAPLETSLTLTRRSRSSRLSSGRRARAGSGSSRNLAVATQKTAWSRAVTNRRGHDGAPAPREATSTTQLQASLSARGRT